MFSESEKNEIKKACTSVVKEAKGRGPGNIYLKFFDDEIVITIDDLMSVYEKRLVEDLGDEALKMLCKNYEKNSSTAAMERLNALTGNRFGFRLKRFEYDIDDKNVNNNKFTYVVGFRKTD